MEDSENNQEATGAVPEGDREQEAGSPLEQREREYQELYDRYVRVLADFDNYKKRAVKEQMENAKYANEKLLKEFLPVLDNLERALIHSRETQEIAKLIEGIELIQKQCLSTLSKFGVTVLESQGQPFDPTYHQAVSQVDTEADAEPNRVVAEAQKGYLLHNRLLRPAMVVVSKKQEGDEGSDSESQDDNPDVNPTGSEAKREE